MALVGRGAEWEQLAGLAAAAVAGTFRLVLVSGDEGVGKTALVSEFGAATTGLRYARVVCVRGAPPLWPWRFAMSQFGLALPTEDLQGFARLSAYTRVLSSIEQPALIALDDLHLADPGSLELLTHLAAVAPARPLLVLGAYRGAVSPAPARGPAVTRLALRGLDPAGTAALARQVPSPTHRTPH